MIQSHYRKIIGPILILASALSLSGCLTRPNAVLLDTVGPVRPLARMTSPIAATGSLVVYSAYRRNADFNARDPDRPEYSDYEICLLDGRRQQWVHNNSGTILQEAVTVSLPIGKYLVKARANGCGIITVPVQIDPQQTTVLHLEGGGFWPDESVLNATNAVRLPGGWVIGWKAGS